MLQKDKAFILSTYFRNEQIIIFAKSENNGILKIILDPKENYFYISKNKDEELNKNYKDGEPIPPTIATNLTCLNTKELLVKKVFPKRRKQDSYIQEHRPNKIYEANLRPNEKFLIDHKIKGQIEIEFDTIENIDRISIIRNPLKISPTKYYPNLKVCSIDIETSGDDEQEIYSIALHTYNTQYEQEDKKCFVQANQNKKISNEIIYSKGEKKLLEDFLDYFHQLNPDIITGWFVIGFDLMQLQKKIKEKYFLNFFIGREEQDSVIEEFGRTFRMDVPGRLIIDAYNFFVNSPIHQYKSYSLETIAQNILGEGKLIKENKEEKVQKIRDQFKNDKKALAEYNIQDCVLVSEIIQTTHIIEQIFLEHSLVGIEFNRQNINSLILDYLYLPVFNKNLYSLPDAQFSKIDKKTKTSYFNHNNTKNHSSPAIRITLKKIIFELIYYCDINYLHKKSNEKSLDFQSLFKKINDLTNNNNEIIKNTGLNIINKIVETTSNQKSRFFNQSILNDINNTLKLIINTTIDFFHSQDIKTLSFSTKEILLTCSKKDFHNLERSWLNHITQKLNISKINISYSKIDEFESLQYIFYKKYIYYIGKKGDEIITENTPTIDGKLIFCQNFIKDIYENYLKKGSKETEHFIRSYIQNLKLGHYDQELYINEKNGRYYINKIGQKVPWHDQKKEFKYDDYIKLLDTNTEHFIQAIYHKKLINFNQQSLF